MEVQLVLKDETGQIEVVEATNIEGLKAIADRIHRLIRNTFVAEFCIGCSVGLAYPDGKCRGCRALKRYNLTLAEVQK